VRLPIYGLKAVIGHWLLLAQSAGLRTGAFDDFAAIHVVASNGK